MLIRIAATFMLALAIAASPTALAGILSGLRR